MPCSERPIEQHVRLDPIHRRAALYARQTVRQYDSGLADTGKDVVRELS